MQDCLRPIPGGLCHDASNHEWLTKVSDSYENIDMKLYPVQVFMKVLPTRRQCLEAEQLSTDEWCGYHLVSSAEPGWLVGSLFIVTVISSVQMFMCLL